MLDVLEVTLPVFALVLCGCLAAARRMLPDRAVEGINAFVFFFALPAMLFRVVALRPLGELLDWRLAGGYATAALAVYLFVYRSARRGRLGIPATDGSHASALALHTTHGNLGYLALPLIAEIDARALPTAALVIVCDIVLVIGLSMVMMELRRHPLRDRAGPAWLPVALSLSRSPLVLAIAAGFAFSLTGAPVPGMLDSFTRLLGAAAGPAALFAIGAALAGQRLRFDREIATLVAVKLVLFPLAVAVSVWTIFRAAPLAAAAGVLCAAMPGASNSFIIAQRYGVPTAAIGAATAAGTVLSVATITVTVWLVGLR